MLSEGRAEIRALGSQRLGEEEVRVGGEGFFSLSLSARARPASWEHNRSWNHKKLREKKEREVAILAARELIKNFARPVRGAPRTPALQQFDRRRRAWQLQQQAWQGQAWQLQQQAWQGQAWQLQQQAWPEQAWPEQAWPEQAWPEQAWQEQAWQEQAWRQQRGPQAQLRDPDWWPSRDAACRRTPEQLGKSGHG